MIKVIITVTDSVVNSVLPVRVFIQLGVEYDLCGDNWNLQVIKALFQFICKSQSIMAYNLTLELDIELKMDIYLVFFFFVTGEKINLFPEEPRD